MELVILIGLQAAGKTTFYQQRFAASHSRVSLDQLKSRARELAEVQSLLAMQRKLVIDNTNPSRAERKKFIDLAKAAEYEVVGYYFEPDIQGCLRRNAARHGKECIPVAGLFGTRKRLQAPSRAEGFDALWKVQVASDGAFSIEPWPDERLAVLAGLAPEDKLNEGR